jgi:hypothetical protein
MGVLHSNNAESFHVLAVGIFVSVGVKQSQASTRETEKMEQGTPPASVTQEQIQNALKKAGIPAVAPQSNAPASAIAGSTSFTEADVRTYIQAHPFPGATIMNGASETVQSIQFATIQEAKAITGDQSTSSDPNAAVCLVTIHGPFSLSNSLLPPGLQRKGWTVPSSVDIVYEILDAKTGNLLLTTIPAQPIAPEVEPQ